MNSSVDISLSLPSMKPSPCINALKGVGSSLVVIHDCQGYQRCIRSSLQHDADGKAYYTFEFTAQAPNFTRHALGAIVIANGKFYTLTTGANERRWEKMKDRLHTVVDSFKIDRL